MTDCQGLRSVFAWSDDGALYVFPLFCKGWGCKTCKPVKLNRFMRRARLGRPNIFATFTCKHGNYANPEEARKHVSHCWRLLRLRLGRLSRRYKFEYLRVWENHKDGFPHLHVLIAGNFLPRPVVKAIWEDLTGAWNVDIRKVDRLETYVHYAAKYVSKGFSEATRRRRYSTSRNWPQEARKQVHEIITGLGKFALDPRETGPLVAAKLGQDAEGQFHPDFPTLFVARAPPLPPLDGPIGPAWPMYIDPFEWLPEKHTPVQYVLEPASEPSQKDSAT